LTDSQYLDSLLPGAESSYIVPVASDAASFTDYANPVDMLKERADDSPTTKRKHVFEPFAKQKQFIDTVFSKEYKYLLYGGAIRGGKTYVGLGIIIMLCKLFPGSRWAVVRADLPRLRRNTIPTFEKIAARPFVGKVNRYDWTCKCANGSEILFITESIRDDPELNRWRGLEVNGVFYDEVNECQEATWDKGIERSGSWVHKDWTTEDKPPILMIATCNPTQGWVKEKFYTPWRLGELKAPYFYMPAKISDNPYVDQEYLDSLKNLPPAVYKRFVDGSWDVDDAINQLISWSTIYACGPLIDYKAQAVAKPQDPGSGQIDDGSGLIIDNTRSLGVDVGRFGPDPTVYVIMEGGNVIKIMSRPKTRTTEVTADVLALCQQFNISADRVGVDGVGLGAGVIDELFEKEFVVRDIIGGASPEEVAEDFFFHFLNLRIQMAWSLKTAMEAGEIGGLTHERMKADIGAIIYEVHGDKTMRLETKDKIKKRIGRSPDYFDALMYANWMRVAGYGDMSMDWV